MNVNWTETMHFGINPTISNFLHPLSSNFQYRLTFYYLFSSIYSIYYLLSSIFAARHFLRVWFASFLFIRSTIIWKLDEYWYRTNAHVMSVFLFLLTNESDHYSFYLIPCYIQVVWLGNLCTTYRIESSISQKCNSTNTRFQHYFRTVIAIYLHVYY